MERLKDWLIMVGLWVTTAAPTQALAITGNDITSYGVGYSLTDTPAASNDVIFGTSSLAGRSVVPEVTNSTFLGKCAGASVTRGRRLLLVGAYTSAPANADGFVNLGNVWCFWFDTNQRVDCPPPESECEAPK